MNTHSDHSAETRIAAGIKTAALVVLLGLIAVVAQPTRMPDEVFSRQPAATEAPATGGASDTSYFPAQFTAPTAVAEQAPTF